MNSIKKIKNWIKLIYIYIIIINIYIIDFYIILLLIIYESIEILLFIYY